MLQLDNVYEMRRGLLFGGFDFGKLERAAQIGPRPAAIDKRPHTDPRIDVVLGGFGHRAPSFFGKLLRGDIPYERCGAGPFQNLTAVEQVDEFHSYLS